MTKSRVGSARLSNAAGWIATAFLMATSVGCGGGESGPGNNLAGIDGATADGTSNGPPVTGGGSSGTDGSTATDAPTASSEGAPDDASEASLSSDASDGSEGAQSEGDEAGEGSTSSDASTSDAASLDASVSPDAPPADASAPDETSTLAEASTTDGATSVDATSSDGGASADAGTLADAAPVAEAGADAASCALGYGARDGSCVLVTFGYGATATTIVGGAHAGQVLIAGGNSNALGTGTDVSTSWLYDPATGAFVVGPTLAQARSFHTAVAMGAGQVVLAGGISRSTGDHEFELCDIDATEVCAVVGSANVSRCRAAAALVHNGTRVLIAGGDNCQGGAAMHSWDRWDSSSQTVLSSSPSNQLTTGRALLTATSIGANEVLLAGGTTAATADLFVDGTTPTVAQTTGAMRAARKGHTATVLSGTSNACPTTGDECVLLAGGVASGTAGTTWEVYDANTDTFARGASSGHDLVAPTRAGHAAAQFADGRVLLMGGSVGGTDTASTEYFDPTMLTFAASAPLATARFEAAAAYSVPLDTAILAGGNASNPPTEEVASP